MIGVVVWTDQALEKAVIWCEDHSDLAYYVRSETEQMGPQNGIDFAGASRRQPAEGQGTGSEGMQGLPLDIRKGDLVLFDAFYEGDCRMARNVRLVQEDSHPMLAECLQTEQTAAMSSAEPVATGAEDNPPAATGSLPQGGADEGSKIVPFVLGGHAVKSGARNTKRKSG